MRYSLRTLLILLMLIPPLVALIWESQFRTVARQRINRELELPTEIDCSEYPLNDLVTQLRDRHQISFRIATGVEEDTPITYKANGVKLRDILSGILHPLGLDFRIKNDAVEIVRVKANR